MYLKDTTETLISTTDDLLLTLRKAHIGMAEIAGSLGLSRQAAESRIVAGSLDEVWHHNTLDKLRHFPSATGTLCLSIENAPGAMNENAPTSA